MPDVPQEAVNAALGAYRHALMDRPTPTALSDEQLMRKVLEAAASVVSGGMRALTVQEPWASAIIYGPKDVENRSWATAYRGALWIHAAKRVDWSASRDAWLAAGLPPPPSGRRFDRSAWTGSLPLGKVIGSVDLTGCHDDSDCYGPLQRPGYGQHPLCSKWAARFQKHWKMDGKSPLPEPVPCRGSLGLWRLPPEVAEAIRQQLVRAL